MPQAFISANVPATVSSSTTPISSPVRSPMKTSSTPTTMANDSIRLTMKSLIDFVT